MTPATAPLYFNHAAICGLLHRIETDELASLGKTLPGLFDPTTPGTYQPMPCDKAMAVLALAWPKLASTAGPLGFTSLEAAFNNTPAGEARLVLAEDRFELVNPVAAVNQRMFLFHIPVASKQDYHESDRYFRRGSRSWSATVAMGCEFCPGLNTLVKIVQLHERFHAYEYRGIPLRVLGCCLKYHQRIHLLPFVIWF